MIQPLLQPQGKQRERRRQPPNRLVLGSRDSSETPDARSGEPGWSPVAGRIWFHQSRRRELVMQNTSLLTIGDQHPNRWASGFLQRHKQFVQINYLDVGFFKSSFRNTDLSNTQINLWKKRRQHGN